MKTKTIFKTLALAMLMPAMMLTTACSSDDDAIINNNETPAKKGYTLPVTINVTRQSEAATRATYTDNGNKTGSLSFSSGDQLFIYGKDSRVNGAGQFAGTLQYVDGTDGTFSGTITTEKTYSGTVEELFSSASSDDNLEVDLLPNGYETYGFFSITEKEGYNDKLNWNYNNTFASTKALAVEQFSMECTYEYDNGFALSPEHCILNFTISGLTASTEVDVALTGNELTITGKVTTDGSGTATFAVGIWAGSYINIYSLTVDGNTINLPEHLAYPKIYNISRSVAAAPTYTMAANATAEDKGKLIGTDGNIYADVEAATAAGTTAVAKIIYIGDTGHGTYNHGLALALTDEASKMVWQAAINACSAKNTSTPVTDATWLLASQNQWEYMMGANGAGSYTALRDGFSDITGASNLQSDYYWSSTETASGSNFARSPHFSNGNWAGRNKTSATSYVRACLAF